MIEILLLYLALLSMAKKKGKRRRRFRKYIRGAVDEELSLGTLAATTLISGGFDSTVVEKTLVSSVVLSWSLTNYTPSAGDGPIIFGLAHSDYTDSEIEAVIENEGSWTEGGKIEQEIARRQVRMVGQFDTPVDAAATVSINDGKPVKTKLNWQLRTGQTLRKWAYNKGTSALATTVPVITVVGHANLWPN